MIKHSEPSSASARDVRTAGKKNLVTLTKTSPPTLTPSELTLPKSTPSTLKPPILTPPTFYDSNQPDLRLGITEKCIANYKENDTHKEQPHGLPLRPRNNDCNASANDDLHTNHVQPVHGACKTTHKRVDNRGEPTPTSCKTGSNPTSLNIKNEHISNNKNEKTARSSTWTEVDKQAVTVQNFLPPQNIKHAIPLLIGHSVEISEESEFWYRGKLKFDTFRKFTSFGDKTNSCDSGIFPKNCVELLPKVTNCKTNELLVSATHEFVGIYIEGFRSDNSFATQELHAEFLNNMHSLVDLKRQLDTDLVFSDNDSSFHSTRDLQISQESLDDGCGFNISSQNSSSMTQGGKMTGHEMNSSTITSRSTNIVTSMKHSNFSTCSLQSRISNGINSQIDKISSQLNLPLMIREGRTNTVINVDQMSTKTVYNLHSEARTKRQNLTSARRNSENSAFTSDETLGSPDFDNFYRVVF